MEPAPNPIRNVEITEAAPIMPGPILDYASPASRSPLRLTSESIIAINAGPNGTEIVESLAGHGQAIGAIAFTSFTVTLLGFGLLSGPAKSRVELTSPGFVIFVLFALGVLALILAVIHANWRQTILLISHERLMLTFKSPFQNLVRQWPAGEIRRVYAIQELDKDLNKFICELRIDLGFGGVIRLYGGHDPPELNDVSVAIRRHLPPEAPL